MKPEGAQYEHDCSNCTFLGSYGPYDLYACKHVGEGKALDQDDPALFLNTVIARCGNEGPDYSSGLVLAYRQYLTKQDTPLAEAYRRAKEQQVWDPEQLRKALEFWLGGEAHASL